MSQSRCWSHIQITIHITIKLILKVFTELTTSPFFPSLFQFALISTFTLIVYHFYQTTKKKSAAKALLLRAAEKRKQRDAKLNIPLPQLNLTPQKVQDILNAPVTKLLDMLNNDEVTSEELLLVFCERVKTIGLSYELIADADFEPALKMARECDRVRQNTPKEQRKSLGLLYGIPISIKDNFRLKGLDSTFGLAHRCFNPETQDAVSVEVLKKHGAVPFIKSNGPQMMMTIESVNNVFGRSLNPWNPERTVGGSSGGEAGLVAARCSPIGLGSDIGGSVRIPALYCGVYAMKGTAERLSSKGIVYPNQAGRNGNTLIKSVIGPIGKCVDDVREMMKVLMSEDLARLDPKAVHLKWNREWEEKPLPKLRIGYIDNDDFFEVCPSNKRAVMETCQVLKQKGHEVISLNGLLPSFHRSYAAYSGIFSAEGKLRSFFHALKGEPIIMEYHQWVTLACMPSFLRNTLAKVLSFLGQQRAASMLRNAGEKKAHELFEYAKEQESMRDEIIHLWREHNLDAIITPGLALPAVHHKKAHTLYINSCYTALWNLVNFPTGSLPITKIKEDETSYDNEKRKHKGDNYDKCAQACLKDAAGLPVGVQLTTLPFEEEKCLAIMKAVEDEVRFYEFPI